MKIVVLSERTKIGGVIREKGEVVRVPDSFNHGKVKRVVKEENGDKPSTETEQE